MKLIFFGSSDYCLPVLNVLHKNFNLVAVITKSSTRAALARLQGLPLPKVFTPHNVAQLLDLKTELTALRPDLAVVADYGLIIPKPIFRLPKHQTVNIHFSRLPQFRGPSPVPQVILSGQTSAFVTLIKMTEKVDAGPTIKQLEYPVNPRKETSKTLYGKLFRLISSDLPEIINDYLSGKLEVKKQAEEKASYTKKLTRRDGYLPFTDFRRALQSTSSAFSASIERTVRAYDPWPGVWTILPNSKRLKIIKAHLEPPVIPSEVEESRANARILVPEIVQIEGKKPVSFKQFLEGYPQLSLLPVSSKASNNSL